MPSGFRQNTMIQRRFDTLYLKWLVILVCVGFQITVLSVYCALEFYSLPVCTLGFKLLVLLFALDVTVFLFTGGKLQMCYKKYNSFKIHRIV